MIQIWLIDELGFFTGESKFVSEEELTDLMITKPILTGYVRTKWNGVDDWEEGATAEEIQAWKDANTPSIPQQDKIDILEQQLLQTQKLLVDLQMEVLLMGL